MCYISLDNISKIYIMGDENISAVSHISFTVEQGEFIAVTGPSGCGKSTLLHIMGGLSVPSGGSVTVRGKSLYEQNAGQRALFRRREGLLMSLNIILFCAFAEQTKLQTMFCNFRANFIGIDVLQYSAFCAGK